MPVTLHLLYIFWHYCLIPSDHQLLHVLVCLDSLQMHHLLLTCPVCDSSKVCGVQLKRLLSPPTKECFSFCFLSFYLKYTPDYLLFPWALKLVVLFYYYYFTASPNYRLSRFYNMGVLCYTRFFLQRELCFSANPKSTKSFEITNLAANAGAVHICLISGW